MTRLLLLLGLVFAPFAAAQPKPGDPVDETAETVDGVKLNCKFYKAAKPGNNSVAILVHDYNADPNKGDWDGLARYLATEVGVNAIRFDLRGHGKSKDINDAVFWADPKNREHVNGYSTTKKKSSIDVKDFKSDYFPMLVNDLAGVRTLLDQKNDKGEVNTRTVYLIGTGSAAPLIQLFLATEYSRPQVKPPPSGLVGVVNDTTSFNSRRQPGTEVAGKDYAGIVLISPTAEYSFPRGNTIAKSKVNMNDLKSWVSKYSRDTVSGDFRDNTSLVVFYGDNDRPSKEESMVFFNDVYKAGERGGKIVEMKNTKLLAAPGAKDKGVDLLGKNNATKLEDTVKAFIEKIESDRKRLNPIDRKFDKPFRINWTSFGVK